MSSPAPSSRIGRSPSVRAAKVGEEQVLLHLGRGHYFSLNPTAAWLWDQLEQPRDLDELQSAMTHSYEVDDTTARADLETVVAELLSESLIRIESTPA